MALGFVVSTSKMAHISRAEFTASLTPLRISSVDALSSHLSKFVSSHLAEGDVGDPVWKSFYAFVGKVCREEGQKNVDWQTACAVWSLIFPSVDGQGGVEASKTARDFVKFANVGEKRIVPKGVGKDIWDQVRPLSARGQTQTMLMSGAAAGRVFGNVQVGRRRSGRIQRGRFVASAV